MLRTPTATAAENQPTDPLLEAIQTSFGSFDKFKQLFSVASVNLFGSGWVWLYIDAQTKHLVLNFTANQDNP
jgi:Fe-Mn family superoxide dismutase